MRARTTPAILCQLPAEDTLVPPNFCTIRATGRANYRDSRAGLNAFGAAEAPKRPDAALMVDSRAVPSRITVLCCIFGLVAQLVRARP